MQIDAYRLKQQLRQVLQDRANYPGERFTLREVMTRAADLATAVVDKVVQQAHTTPAPTGRRHPEEAARESARRTEEANAKRTRLVEVLREAGGPLRYRDLSRKAGLTTGELSWLLKSTPAVVNVGHAHYDLAERVRPAAAAGTR